MVPEPLAGTAKVTSALNAFGGVDMVEALGERYTARTV
jgi:hypothetical protein